MSEVHSSKIEINIKGQKLSLLAEKAIYWRDRKSLLLADLHLGKTSHFRKNGIAVPNQANQANLDRLDLIIETNKVEVVYFLGDLFHSSFNAAFDDFVRWKKRHPSIQFELILGNHDILNQELYEQADLLLSHEKKLGPFLLRHEPAAEKEDLYVLAGHTHPGVTLRGKGKQRQRLACFYFNKAGGILPAFGNFTGLHLLPIHQGDQVYPVLNNSLLDFSSASSSNQAP